VHLVQRQDNLTFTVDGDTLQIYRITNLVASLTVWAVYPDRHKDIHDS